MFSTTQFDGKSLPEKTLCFTFDDGPGETEGNGPGPKTLRLAEYLHDEDIFATFFMVGKFIAQYPHVLQAVSKLGHIIANHTYTHPHMPKFFNNGGDVTYEIAETDKLIADCIPNNLFFFRAPYGRWSPDIANHLNQRLVGGLNHIGPFYWDVLGGDYSFWEKRKSAEKCAAHYLKEIAKKKKGIILMHDSSADNDKMKMNNLTYETVRILVPQLKSLGYNFVRLDKIPGILY
jgi:peptidoglycan/xylan/chitin deacetylase (PgdA/CDA1 family)